jgi:4-hydroxy-3-polyprenylbenzoate decarboxylase
MAYKNLADFISRLEISGELVRISGKVSPYLEISEITDRVSKNNGKALLFENTGTDFLLLINAMGSEKRICLALGVNNLEEVGDRIKLLFEELTIPRPGLIDKISVLPKLGEIASWMPRVRKGRGDCQQVIMNEPDLSKLPVLTCWPHDGGPFITLPSVHTVHPVTGQRNVGMYRMQVMGKTETGMHWHLHKGSAAHFREYKRLKRKMPIAVTLGGDPVYTYSATAPLPENIDEYLLAGFLRRKKVEMVKCLTNNLLVPSDVDFVIEGYVDPQEDLVLEGPFGDHTGYYSLADYYPKFHVTCITHKKGAVYPATIVGIPPQEDAWMGKATERIFLTPIRMTMAPEIVDMIMPPEGVFHNIVIAKIKAEYPGQPAKVMNALWGAGQMMFNKVMIVLDSDADLADSAELLAKIVLNADPHEDIIFNRGPVDVLDHASSVFAYGSKLGIDATCKKAGEKVFTDSSQKLSELNNCYEVQVYDKLQKAEGLPLVILGIRKSEPGFLNDLHTRLCSDGLLDGFRYVVYIDHFALDLNPGDIAWLVSNNIDPVRDCFFADGNKGPLAIDGTMKSAKLDNFSRDWPNVVVMDDITIEKVDEMWNDLGLGNFLPSPSKKYKALIRNDGAVAADSEIS